MTTIALIGNPNVGKTELFNRLTGLKQHVGNWPGVTVEKKTGKYSNNGEDIKVVDLPGTYSLTAQAKDELIARNYLVLDRPDVVINIIDGTKLERNLYLTLLLLEMEANVVMALNRWDLVKEKHIEVDTDKLSKRLGIPIVPTVATTGEGLEELKKAVMKAAQTKENQRKNEFGYGEDVEQAISDVETSIRKDWNLSKNYPSRWLAIKVLEKDSQALDLIKDSPQRREIMGAKG